MLNGHTIILVDPDPQSTGVLAGRLRMQGYHVVEASDPAEGGRLALAQPPSAVVADLWMPKISGVQLCRLLRSELATRHVPIVLRGPEGQRNRFWAERAGAVAYVVRGRMGELVRALERAIAAQPPQEHFWSDLTGSVDEVRDKIAELLDSALFESVVAGEVRALGTCAEFDRLFDLLSQFVSEVTSYRWLAVATEQPRRFGLHASPRTRAVAEDEARAAFEFDETVRVTTIEDDDAYGDEQGPAPIVRPIQLGPERIGQLAMAVRGPEHPRDAELVEVIARELAGPIRIATLVEESRHLATVDGLTGLMNRRAFLQALDAEIARAQRHQRPLSVVLLDVDHFKHINDGHGHASGDMVLAQVGGVLARHARKGDLVARWGGEEFVMALHATGLEGGTIAAERRRVALEALRLASPSGAPIPVTASFGVVELAPGEGVDAVIDRADRNMYSAKSSGRNRVVATPNAKAASDPAPASGVSVRPAPMSAASGG